MSFQQPSAETASTDGVAAPEISQAPASETTPLLSPAEAGQDDAAAAPAGDDKPMPKVQVALLCFARLIEPIAFFSIFPYINQMVQDNGDIANTDVGFYSGVIESLFSLTQAIVMLAWGRAADRVGRKPVLVFSLFGMASATGLFGLARTLGQMIAFRCLAGVFSGTIVTIRTMLAEHSTSKTQARVFSWFAFSGNLGIFLGPLLGGALADPLRRHSSEGNAGMGSMGIIGNIGSLFTNAISLSSPDVPFLAAYPYALPGFVVAGLGFLAAFTSLFFVDETLVSRKTTVVTATGESGEATSTEAPDSSISHLLKAPGVGIVLYNYAHIMVLAFSYTALVPVFWFTPVSLGGLGFTTLQISGVMGLTGAGQALWLLVVFPLLQQRIGTNGVMRLCAFAYPVFMAISPAASLLLRIWDAHTLFWVVVPPIMVVGSGVSMCFTAVQLAVNDVAPSPRLLGTLNALALTGVCVIRAFTPALFTSLYAINARNQLLGGYAIWVLMVVIALGFTAVVRYLPDYDALKKQRAEQQE